jgi:hypothetical protein
VEDIFGVLVVTRAGQSLCTLAATVAAEARGFFNAITITPRRPTPGKNHRAG